MGVLARVVKPYAVGIAFEANKVYPGDDFGGADRFQRYRKQKQSRRRRGIGNCPFNRPSTLKHIPSNLPFGSDITRKQINLRLPCKAGKLRRLRRRVFAEYHFRRRSGALEELKPQPRRGEAEFSKFFAAIFGFIQHTKRRGNVEKTQPQIDMPGNRRTEIRAVAAPKMRAAPLEGGLLATGFERNALDILCRNVENADQRRAFSGHILRPSPREGDCGDQRDHQQPGRNADKDRARTVLQRRRHQTTPPNNATASGKNTTNTKNVICISWCVIRTSGRLYVNGLSLGPLVSSASQRMEATTRSPLET